MRHVTHLLVVSGLVVLGLTSIARAAPAFSGAEGWGAVTPGGRGGQVIHVTNLNDSGAGSFRAAVTANGPRTVVFDIAGRINLNSEVSITNPFLTIAGHTAPGDGVTIAGETVSLDTHDIAIRYMRFRRGNTTRADDALGSDRTTGNIIIDHVSASWGLDENLSVYRNKLDQPIVPGGSTVLPSRNITVQWSISSEALNPNNHAFGSTLGGAGVNFHHNLWASNTGRNPSISFSHFMDIRNNVLFNWQHRSVDGAGEEAHVNMVNNYYKSGPATNAGQLKYRIVKPELRDGVVGNGEAGWWHVEGNHVEGFGSITANNWAGGVQFDLPGMQEQWVRSLTPHTHVEFPNDPDDPNDDVGGVPIPIPDLPTVATQTAGNAYQSVLAGAGATLPLRDPVDTRVTNSVATGIATAGPNANGIINSPSDVGGYPTIPLVTRAAGWDTDQDGMPDAWEAAHGLNPVSAADRNGDFDTDDFTNLEEYLNELGAFAAVRPIVWDGGVGRYARIENWDIAFQPSRLDTARISSGQATVDAIAQHAGTLHVGEPAGASASLVMGGGGVLNIHKVLHVHESGSVQFNGGAIDLRDGAAVFDQPAVEADLLTDLVLQIQNGRAGGAWNGPGLLSSLAAADTDTFGVGIVRNGELSAPWTTFAGEAVSPDSILLRVTFLGDTDLDGDVDIADLGSLASNWQSSGTWIDGDFDYNDVVNINDLGLLASNWQSGVPAGPAPTDSYPWAFDDALSSLGLPSASVPEPLAAMLLTSINLGVLRRRRA